MNNTYYIESAGFAGFLNALQKQYKVFSPVLKDDQENIKDNQKDYRYQAFSDAGSFLYNPYRVIEPLKIFFTHPYEKLSAYFTPEKDITEAAEKTVVLGVKACDIAGHKIQDFVFLEGVEVDSLYRLRRDNTIFISSDCTDFKEVCHCLAWGILPHPVSGFDLNLSPLNDGYLVEAGSERGGELIGVHKEYFTAAKEVQTRARKEKRDALIERLRRHLLPQGLVPKENAQKLVKEGYNAQTWKNFMLTCVECGGCNFICDTCHCFLLADKQEGQQNKKTRLWDACLYANYARVAGGANPLKLRAQRLRFRYTKKFDFFIENLGIPACCGCGRCIEVCPGKIDIREVLKDLASKVKI